LSNPRAVAGAGTPADRAARARSFCPAWRAASASPATAPLARIERLARFGRVPRRRSSVARRSPQKLLACSAASFAWSGLRGATPGAGFLLQMERQSPTEPGGSSPGRQAAAATTMLDRHANGSRTLAAASQEAT
jgi:hypothetical protein